MRIAGEGNSRMLVTAFADLPRLDQAACGRELLRRRGIQTRIQIRRPCGKTVRITRSFVTETKPPGSRNELTGPFPPFTSCS